MVFTTTSEPCPVPGDHRHWTVYIYIYTWSMLTQLENTSVLSISPAFWLVCIFEWMVLAEAD